MARTWTTRTHPRADDPRSDAALLGRRMRMITAPWTPLDRQPHLAAYLPGAPPLMARRLDANALRRRALLRHWRRVAPVAVAACSGALATIALYTWTVLELVVP
ncbi:MAG: hypothetical protein QOI36_957 [Pseudonocardiales bacterium]|jgi:hypothetical protein|nr:hypothetical protein [Pseudonocardia sp.]MDT7649551.1 hypothetical protein [Pseudonocardiales bacterium]